MLFIFYVYIYIYIYIYTVTYILLVFCYYHYSDFQICNALEKEFLKYLYEIFVKCL